MHHDAADRRRLIEQPGIGLALRGDIGIHLAPHDPCIGQHQQAVDKHLAATVKPLGKGVHTALALDQRLPGQHVDISQQRPIPVVIGMTGQQRRRQRIAHGADADLQGPAIAHQRTGMQADKMILAAHRHVRSGEQRTLLLLVDQQVEGLTVDLRIALHIGQVAMDLGQQ